MECIFRCPVIMSMLVVRRVVLPAELVFLIYRTLFLPLLAIEIGSTFFKQTGKVCGRRRRSNWGRSERGYWWEKERLSFPFPFCAFLPLPSPSFFVPATQAKESVAAEIYNSCTIQYNTILGFSWCTALFFSLVCHVFENAGFIVFLYICSSTLMVFLLSQAYNPVETMAISSQVWNSQNYK